MEIDKAIAISAHGMDAQAVRLRVIAQNLANADSTGTTPGSKPYQRQTVSFQNQMNHSMGVDLVQVGRIGTDPTPFPKRYDPSSPAANTQGYVLMPNVNPMVELMDMQDAEHSYSANLNVMQVTRNMLIRTIGMLK